MSGVSAMVLTLREMPASFTTYFDPTPSMRSAGLTKIDAFEMDTAIMPPFIIVNLISEPSEMTLKGATGAHTSRVSIEMVGKPFEGARQNKGEFMTATQRVVDYLATFSGRRRQVGNYVLTIMKMESDVTETDDDRLLPRRILDYNCRWRRVD